LGLVKNVTHRNSRNVSTRIRLRLAASLLYSASLATKWFQLPNPQSPLTCSDYLEHEFGLSDSSPIYSRGLGNIAGDLTVEG